MLPSRRSCCNAAKWLRFAAAQQLPALLLGDVSDDGGINLAAGSRASKRALAAQEPMTSGRHASYLCMALPRRPRSWPRHASLLLAASITTSSSCSLPRQPSRAAPDLSHEPEENPRAAASGPQQQQQQQQQQPASSSPLRPGQAPAGPAAAAGGGGEARQQRPVRYLFRGGALHPLYPEDLEQEQEQAATSHAAVGQASSAQPQRLDRQQWGGPSEQEVADAAKGDEEGDLEVDLGYVFALPRPHERLQPHLVGAELSALREEANRRARVKELVSVRVGRRSLTPAFVAECGNALEMHEYLRVRLALQGGLQRAFVEFVLCTLLDALCVFRRGNTLVLYREQGHPRPSSSRTKDQLERDRRE
jgi:RNA-binding protein YhbY